MRMARIARGLLVPGLVFAVYLALETSGAAQCSMCRASLGGSNNPFFIRNFNVAVLVLLAPPVAIFCSIFVVLRRHSTPADDSADADPDES